MSRIKVIVLLHCFLALAPVCMRFVPPHVRALPVIWAFASINLSQLMLLAIYVAMFAGNFRPRLLVATAGVFYIGICQVIGERGMDVGTWVAPPASPYVRYLGMDAGTLIILTGLLAVARGSMGFIRRMQVSPLKPADARSQFSLLTLLLVISLAALVLGLVESSRQAAGEKENAAAMIVQYVLFAIVFGTNLLATLPSTLGVGRVSGKLAIVFAVSAILGLSLGVSFGHDKIGWWLLPGSSLMTLIPTAIIASTLLLLRPLGFRLTRVAADATPIEA